MGNKSIKKVVMLLLTVLPLYFYGQECVDYHRLKCSSDPNKKTLIAGEKTSEGYSYNPDSRSGLLLKGQTSEFKIELRQEKDYRITICYDDILGDKVSFKILDYEDNSVLYNSADNNYEKVFEFQVQVTRPVKIVVSVPADSKPTEATVLGLKAKTTQMGCVGILIETMVTPKTGF